MSTTIITKRVVAQCRANAKIIGDGYWIEAGTCFERDVQEAVLLMQSGSVTILSTRETVEVVATEDSTPEELAAFHRAAPGPDAHRLMEAPPGSRVR